MLRVCNLALGLRSAITLQGKQGATHLVLLSREDADQLWKVEIKGHDQLVLTKAQVFSDGARLILRQIGDPFFDAAFLPAVHAVAGREADRVTAPEAGEIFQHLAWHKPERSVSLQIEKTRPVGNAPAPKLNAGPSQKGSAPVEAPDESSFAQAGEWRVIVPPRVVDGLSDIFLGVHYQGDEARLLNGDHLLTDNFFNGTEWRIGMKRFLNGGPSLAFTLQVLPLNKEAPIFMDEGRAPAMGKDEQTGSLQAIEALPEYEIDLAF